MLTRGIANIGVRGTGELLSTVKFMVQTLSAAGELQRDLQRELTYDGLRAAEAKGNKGGRRPAVAVWKVDAVRAAYLEGRSIAALARDHDVSRGAIRTAVADLLPQYTAAAPDALDMPGKVADFLRAADLEPAERATLDQGITVRRGQCGKAVESRGQFVSPGPGRRDPQAEAASTAGEAGGNVQQSVVMFLGFGSGQFAIQQKDSGPGEEIDRCEAEFEPGGVDVEMAGGDASEASGLTAPDVVPDGGVSALADLKEPCGAAAGVGGIGQECLMVQARVVVEQGQLGAGVRSFAPHGDAGAGRVTGEVDHAGQFGDFGAVSQCPVLVQGGMPESFGQ